MNLGGKKMKNAGILLLQFESIVLLMVQVLFMMNFQSFVDKLGDWSKIGNIVRISTQLRIFLFSDINNNAYGLYIILFELLYRSELRSINYVKIEILIIKMIDKLVVEK